MKWKPPAKKESVRFRNVFLWWPTNLKDGYIRWLCWITVREEYIRRGDLRPSAWYVFAFGEGRNSATAWLSRDMMIKSSNFPENSRLHISELPIAIRL